MYSVESFSSTVIVGRVSVEFGLVFGDEGSFSDEVRCSAFSPETTVAIAGVIAEKERESECIQVREIGERERVYMCAGSA